MAQGIDVQFIPAHFQPALPLNQIILSEAPREDAVSLDVLFVGGGPAGLAGAIHLKKLISQANSASLSQIEIGVLEKSADLGNHCLSGAIIDPRPLFELFPDLQVGDFPFYSRVEQEAFYFLTRKHHLSFPIPRVMKNDGYYVASICELVTWLGEKAKELGISTFTGFPAKSLLVEGERVRGVRTAPAGLSRDGAPGPSFLPPTDVLAKVTVLAEGARGLLTQAYLDWKGVSSPNPQIYALGVKELWETSNVPQQVIHTMGWPVPKDSFGGAWIYPMGKNLISFGLVVGLDYLQSNLDVHNLLQELKEHSVLKPHLKKGQILEWGAKIIPEGGYHSIPERLHGDGLIVIGDSAGFVNVASLKGIHYAVRSGMIAAETIFKALSKEDYSSAVLADYDVRIRESEIIRDLYETRNMRLAFKEGLYKGGFKAELMAMTRGHIPGQKINIKSDADVPKVYSRSSQTLGLKKEDAVFHSGNKTRDDIPQHLIVGDSNLSEVIEFYAHMCPAGVYEKIGGKLVVSSPNCIDCKTTDVLGPRWTPREGGSGPRYRRM